MAPVDPHASIEKTLTDTTAAISYHTVALEHALQERARAICDAMDHHIPATHIRELTGLSIARIYQIQKPHRGPKNVH